MFPLLFLDNYEIHIHTLSLQFQLTLFLFGQIPLFPFCSISIHLSLITQKNKIEILFYVYNLQHSKPIGLKQQLTENILCIRNAHIYLTFPMKDAVLTVTTLQAYPYPIYNKNPSKNNKVNYIVEYPYFFVDNSPL